jgi:superfamily II DNA or RNA helicase
MPKPSVKTNRKPWRFPASCDEILRSIRSWEDFRRAAKELSDNKSKGDLFERFVQHFLRHDPAYVVQLSEVWLYQEVPVNVKRSLNLSDQDRGIDLIALTKAGDYWAVQAKFRVDEAGSMSLRELSTFAAQVGSIGRGMVRGLICATKRETNLEFSNASFPFQHVLLETWESLPPEFWKSIRQAADGESAPPPVPYEPKKYQSAALESARNYFLGQDERRGKLIMPCGTGKSLMGYWTAVRSLKAQTVLVAVPSLDLIRQTFAVWARESVANQQQLDVMIVCSDGTTTKGDVHVDELAAPATTIPGEIRTWLKKPQESDVLRVVFVTYQSGKVLADAVGRFVFDVAIFDEAHKTAGFEGKRNQHLLHEKNLSVRHRVFMTATERYYEGDSDEVVGMNDERLYGERYHYMPFADAINEGILADYSVVLLAVTQAEAARYRPLIEERVYVRADWDHEDASAPDALTTEDLATAVALRKAMRRYRLNHAVSFHSRNRMAQDFVAIQQSLNGAGLSAPLKTYRVSSELSSGKRGEQIKGFQESEMALISNARCLTEGVDVPGIDLVLFAQPRQSKVDIVQAVGRALRKPQDQPDKRGYVLVPVLVDDEELDLEEVVAGTGFENLVSVMKAMATVDDDITDRITVVLSKGPRKSAREGGSDSEAGEVISKHVSLDRFAEALKLRAWDRLEGLVKPRLEIEQILRWAKAHQKRNEKWPTLTAGKIPEAPGETWLHVQSALVKGLRGLAGGSSLAQLLNGELGVRNVHNLPSLSEEQILGWAKVHRETTGKWPTRKSGEIPDFPGEKWANIDAALGRGARGLAGGSSLARLLEERLDVRNKGNLPPFSEEEIVRWAKAYHTRVGKWPGQNSGKIPESSGDSWTAVHQAFVKGHRGLAGGSSLATFLEERFDMRNKGNLPPFSEEEIVRWAKAYHAREGKWPGQESGKIPESPGESWNGVDKALSRGQRGLAGGSSLAQLLEGGLGVRNIKNLPPLSEEQILGWAKAHQKRNGKWPNISSGIIPESPGDKWVNINAALAKGLRRLAGGSSLAQLLDQELGVRNIKNLPPLSEEKILGWAKAHRKKNGKWPIMTSGKIFNAPEETWSAVDGAIKQGNRGLAGGSSLARLLEERLDVRNKGNLPPFSEEEIVRWVKAYHTRVGKWPGQKSGKIPESPGESWNGVDKALSRGQRGLAGDSSLAKLIAKHCM